MDTITIIVIIVLIIFIIAGIYFYQEMTDKIEILEEENTKIKEDKTAFLDETSELKKTIRRIANDVNERLTRTEDKVEDVEKETFSLSMHSKDYDIGPHPAVAAYGKHALPPRDQRQNGSAMGGMKPPGMSDEMYEKINKAKSEGMRQSNCEVNEEMFDPGKKITPKNVEYDRMDPASVAAERRAEGFAGGNGDNTWRPQMNAMVQQGIQARQNQNSVLDHQGGGGVNQGFQDHQEYQDEFIQPGGFDFETGDINIDSVDDFF